MDAKTAKDLILHKEGMQIELKAGTTGFPQSIYETVVAFLNRHGGHLFIGVNDDGKIIGLANEQLPKWKKEFVSSLNNGIKIFPTIYAQLEEITIQGKTILYAYIPEGSFVYKLDGYKIYDRNEDGDFEITNNPALVSEMYLRKKASYSENKIYPYAQLSDLDESVFQRVREMVSIRNNNHLWLSMDNMEILKSAGFYMKDMETGKEGITLGGILVFGKQPTIQSVLPHYKTDVIVRMDNVERYDDRDDIRVNLLESYERIMNMIRKHLDEGFYLEKDVRISPRDVLFREVVVNCLIHREFLSQYPARIVIEKNQVLIENGNRPHGFGEVNPIHFTPFPKNPNIAKFFKEIGLAEELGSGIRTCVKYLRIYKNSTPVFVEGDIFKTYIPLQSEEEKQREQGSLKEELLELLTTMERLQRADIEKHLHIKKTKAVELLNELIQDEQLERIKDGAKVFYQRKQ